MKRLTVWKVLLLAAFCILVFDISKTNAQQKRRPTRSSGSSRRTATRSNAAKPSVAVSAVAKEGATEVGFQIKNLSKFIYLLGSSAQSIKIVETEAKQGKVSQSARQKSDIGKKSLISAITIQKNTMLDLEEKFRSNTALKPYLLQLTGVGELASTAEDQAAAGDFDQAGRTLLEVLNQLTDTLQAMP